MAEALTLEQLEPCGPTLFGIRYLNKNNLDSQVAGNNRPLYPKVDPSWFKVAHNYEPLALQEERIWTLWASGVGVELQSTGGLPARHLQAGQSGSGTLSAARWADPLLTEAPQGSPVSRTRFIPRDSYVAPFWL